MPLIIVLIGIKLLSNNYSSHYFANKLFPVNLSMSIFNYVTFYISCLYFILITKTITYLT